jgi:hypothetical protein
LSQLFGRPPQFFYHLQHAQMLSRALARTSALDFRATCAIHIAHKTSHDAVIRSS